jgi:hypothetical protein
MMAYADMTKTTPASQAGVFSAGSLSVVDCVFSKGNAVASGAGLYISKQGSQLASIVNR